VVKKMFLLKLIYLLSHLVHLYTSPVIQNNIYFLIKINATSKIFTIYFKPQKLKFMTLLFTKCKISIYINITNSIVIFI